MPEIILNKGKMVSFRLSLDTERSLRRFLTDQNIGMQHLLVAFSKRVVEYADNKLYLDSQKKFIVDLVRSAIILKENNNYDRGSIRASNCAGNHAGSEGSPDDETGFHGDGNMVAPGVGGEVALGEGGGSMVRSDERPDARNREKGQKGKADQTEILYSGGKNKHSGGARS